MNGERRAELIEAFLDEHCRAVMRDKGTEYSRGEVDVNSNFKRGAEAINADPISVLYIYLSKHLDSIAHYVKNRTTPSGESIEGRIGDAVNYLLILHTLIAELDEGDDVVIDAADAVWDAAGQAWNVATSEDGLWIIIPVDADLEPCCEPADDELESDDELDESYSAYEKFCSHDRGRTGRPGDALGSEHGFGTNDR